MDNRFNIERGSTNVNVAIFIRSTATGYPTGKTGLVYNSAGQTAYYYRPGSAASVALTLATATVGVYVASGFKEIDATNMPGYYQFGVPPAILASGASNAFLMIKGAAGAANCPIHFRLMEYDEGTTYDRVDEAYLAAESVARFEDAIRRLSVALGAKKRDK